MTTSEGKWLRRRARTPGLADRLRRARQEAKLTQEEVAERLNVNRKTLYVWEAGRSEPTRARLASLAVVYGKPVEWFTEGAGDEVTVRLDEIRNRITKLPPEYLDTVESFLSALEMSAGVRR